MLQSKNPPALSSDKVREHSVHPDLFWKLGLAKLYGSGLLQAEEFPGFLAIFCFSSSVTKLEKRANRTRGPQRY